MRRRNFLQGMAATFAAILTPFKAKSAEWVARPGFVRLKGWRLRCIANLTFKWLGDAEDPRHTLGSFNLFLNTPYTERMALGTTEKYMKDQIIQDRATAPIMLMEEKYKAFTDLREVIRNAILHERYRNIEPPIGA